MATSTSLSLEEQETVISYDRSTDKMTVYTANPFEIARLEKMAAYRKVKEDKNGGRVVSATFEADKHLLTLRSERVKGRKMTDKEKEAARERMLAYHATRKAVSLVKG